MGRRTDRVGQKLLRKSSRRFRRYDQESDTKRSTRPSSGKPNLPNSLSPLSTYLVSVAQEQYRKANERNARGSASHSLSTEGWVGLMCLLGGMLGLFVAWHKGWL